MVKCVPLCSHQSFNTRKGVFLYLVQRGENPRRGLRGETATAGEVLCSHQSFNTRKGVFYFCGKGANLPVAQFAWAAAAAFGIVAVDCYAIFGALFDMGAVSFVINMRVCVV